MSPLSLSQSLSKKKRGGGYLCPTLPNPTLPQSHPGLIPSSSLCKKERHVLTQLHPVCFLPLSLVFKGDALFGALFDVLAGGGDSIPADLLEKFLLEGAPALARSGGAGVGGAAAVLLLLAGD